MNRLTIILTIIFAVAGSAMASAVDYPTYKPTTPQYAAPVYSVADGSLYDQQQSFNSTSSYSKQIEENASRRTLNPYDASGMQVNHSYTVPVAASAITGGITTDDLEEGRSGVRRVHHRPGGGTDPVQPSEPESPLPLGDTPWFFMFLLLFAYSAFRALRTYRTIRRSESFVH